jgi:hypothetical protein
LSALRQQQAKEEEDNKKRRTKKNIGFEALAAMILKSLITWVVTPSSSIKFIDVSEERFVTIFRVDAKQETRNKQAACRRWRRRSSKTSVNFFPTT